MHIVSIVHSPIRRRVQRRMYLPSERMVVNGVGLGEVDGFNIGKMLNRMFTIRPGSFKIGNIMGAIGSGWSNFMTLGMGSALAPKTFSAHSTTMKQVGMGVSAAAAAAGAYYGGGALLQTGAGQAFMSGAGNLLKGAGSLVSKYGTGVLKTGIEMVTSSKGGGGGGATPSQESGGMTQAQYNAAVIQQQQAEYYAQKQREEAIIIAQQQAAYEAQLKREAQFGANMSTGEQLAPTMYPGMSSTGSIGEFGPYAPEGQLQSPYSLLSDPAALSLVDPATGLITDPVTGKKIDINTGKVVQAGMFPQLSTATWVAVGGMTLVGMYLMSGNKSTN